MRALQAQKLSEELAQIRAELDTLPDANTHAISKGASAVVHGSR